MVDPVEHLRAAALSTLKSKRRKPPPERPLAPKLARRAPPTESLQLDYGMDEDFIKPAKVTPSMQQNGSHPISLEESSPQDFDDRGHSREEGEISEDEDIPRTTQITPMQQPLASSTTIGSRGPEPTTFMGQPPSQSMLTHRITVPQSSPLNLVPALMQRLSEPMPTAHNQVEEDGSMMHIDQVSHMVDSEHVRPGLKLTQEEYDTAKDIVLDLLGWGVDISYLLEYGINKSLLYYIFNELNLRLPDDFDISGITMYTPEIFVQYGALPLQHSRQVSTSSETMLQPSLSSRLTTSSSIFDAMSFQAGAPISNLSDMERSRRQELLARKAVQDSRKQSRSDARLNSPSVRAVDALRNHMEKQSGTANSPVTENNSPTILVPPDTVDDFLNSLGPVHHLHSSLNEIPSHSAVLSELEDAMDVDQTVERDKPAKGYEGDSSSDRSFSESPLPSSEPPPTSVSSVSTAFSTATNTSSLTKASFFAPAPTPARRVTKRPVASDFVDFDSSTPEQEADRPPSRSDGHSRSTVILRRSFTTGFHNVGASRRCIIDLSDSEDDDVHHPSGQWPSSHHLEDITRQRREAIRQGKANVHAIPTPFKPSDTMPLDVLAEKESQIRKMRELIAKREEETRLRKLAMVKSQFNPAARPSSTVPSYVTTLKQEDLDVAAESLGSNGQSNKGAQVPESGTPLEATSMPSSPRASDTSTELGSFDKIKDVIVLEQNEELLKDSGSSRYQPHAKFGAERISSLSRSSRRRHKPVVVDTGFPLPDLKNLKLVAAIKSFDPSRRLCQYEIPGGGTCRDDGCEDIHLGRLEGAHSEGVAEPSFEDTAQYLFSVLPRSWLDQHLITSPLPILSALEQNNDKGTTSLEERVAKALLSLGPATVA